MSNVVAMTPWDPAAIDKLPADTAAAVRSAITSIEDARKSVLSADVATDRGALDVAEYLKIAKDTRTELEKRRKDLNRPHEEAVKTCNATFAPVTRALDAVIDDAAQAILKWERLQEQRRREAEAERQRQVAAAAEAERKRREEAEQLRAQQDQQRAAAAQQAAADAGGPVDVDEAAPLDMHDAFAAMGATPEEVADLMVPPVPPPPRGLRTAGYGTSSVVRRWKAEVIDLVKVAKKYPQLLTLDTAAADKLRAALHAKECKTAEVVEFDGLRFTVDRGVRTR